MLLAGFILVSVLALGICGRFGHRNHSSNYGQSRPNASGGEFIAILVILAIVLFVIVPSLP